MDNWTAFCCRWRLHSLVIPDANNYMKKIVIVGAGAFGREVCSWIEQIISAGVDWSIMGFVDDRADAVSGMDYPLPVFSDISNFHPTGDELVVCAIGTPGAREAVAGLLKRKGAKFANVIHPTAVFGRNVTWGEGVIIAPYVALSCDIVIGDFCVISSFSGVGHDCRIGDYVQISSHCSVNGGVSLSNGVFLGAQATVIPRVSVGESAFVGAGSVVIRRVQASKRVFGNPATEW